MATLLRTRQFADANVTLAKIANASANSRLLGSGASGSGSAYSEITLGTNLSMSGTTLNATGGGGGTPGGSDTQVQFNDAGSFGGDAGFTYDKTTDSLTLAGNQTFSGSAKRIKGDLSNATRSTRLSFQTSTTDSNTLVQAIPSGTGTLSGFLAYGASDPDNSAYLQAHAEDSVHVGLNSGKSGTGTTQDLVFQIDGTTKAKVNAADGKFNVDTLTASEIVATDASKNLQTLPVASYPSLTELAYVKGVTSAIQTQINAKQNTLTEVNFGSFINGLTAKTTPVDADLMNVVDSADSNKEKKVTWANIKATLKTYFDTLYPALASINVWSAPQRATVTTLTDAATIALDLSLTSNYRVTLAGNRTLGIPTNMANAIQTGLITVWQDITGSRTLAYGAGGGSWPYIFQGGSAPILAAGKGCFDELVYALKYYSTSTVTLTIAAPCVVTQVGHGFITGYRGQFSTTGALPTGLSAATTYWVTVVDADTFKLSTSLANMQAATFITTTGSQSGTHTFVAAGITINLSPNNQ